MGRSARFQDRHQRRSHSAHGGIPGHQGTGVPESSSPRRPPLESCRRRRCTQPGDARQDRSEHPVPTRRWLNCPQAKFESTHLTGARPKRVAGAVLFRPTRVGSRHPAPRIKQAYSFPVCRELISHPNAAQELILAKTKGLLVAQNCR